MHIVFMLAGALHALLPPFRPLLSRMRSFWHQAPHMQHTQDGASDPDGRFVRCQGSEA